MEMLTTPRSKATPTQAAAQQPLPGAHWLGHMLDELAYGMLLLDAQGRLLHANHAARSACAGHHPLQLLGDRLQARHDEHAALLDEALQDGQRGRDGRAVHQHPFRHPQLQESGIKQICL